MKAIDRWADVTTRPSRLLLLLYTSQFPPLFLSLFTLAAIDRGIRFLIFPSSHWAHWCDASLDIVQKDKSRSVRLNNRDSTRPLIRSRTLRIGSKKKKDAKLKTKRNLTTQSITDYYYWCSPFFLFSDFLLSFCCCCLGVLLYRRAVSLLDVLTWLAFFFLHHPFVCFFLFVTSAIGAIPLDS